MILAASINARIAQSCPSKNEFRFANGWIFIFSTSKRDLHLKSSSVNDPISVFVSLNADSGQQTCHRPAWHGDSIVTNSSFISGSNPRMNFLTRIGKFPGHELDRFMENSSNQYKWVPIQFGSNSGHAAWARPIYGKLMQSSILEVGWVFQKSV